MSEYRLVRVRKHWYSFRRAWDCLRNGNSLGWSYRYESDARIHLSDVRKFESYIRRHP